MNITRSSAKVHPGIALALLSSLRDKDTPDESLEDESYAESLPRRLGLNDVVNLQMRRYADLRDAGRSLELTEFLDLVRLISRRPDATDIFRSAGAALAFERFAESGPLSRAFRRMYPEGVRRRKLVRSMTSAGKALSPGTEIVTGRTPPGLVIDACALAPAGLHGNACEILTSVLDVCASEILDASLSVRHTECLGRGHDRCVWTVVASEGVGEAGQSEVPDGPAVNGNGDTRAAS